MARELWLLPLLLAVAGVATATADAAGPRWCIGNAGCRAGLWKCLSAAGVEFVNGARPEALKNASDVWNLLYQTSSPLAVAYPWSYAAVARVVRCARSAGVKVVARSGGASFMGYSVRDGAVTIDLSRMQSVSVSPDRRTVTAQGGATLGQLYYQVWKQAGNLTTVNVGTCPNVGVTGHILGGGMGYLTMAHGLACDKLVSMLMVDARGRLVRADQRRNAGLLAASCGGGGGNFGLVVEMTLALVPVAPRYTLSSVEVVAGKEAAFMEWLERSVLSTTAAHPSLFLEPRLARGRARVGLHFPGRKAELEAELRRLQLLGPGSPWVAADALSENSTQELTWIESAVAFAGSRASSKAPEVLLDTADMWSRRNSFKTLTVCAQQLTNASGWQAVWEALQAAGSNMQFKRQGPQTAVARVPAGATAFPWRTALFCAQVARGWNTPEEAPAALAAMRALRAELTRVFGQAGYVNYLDDALPLRAYYGANLPWLQRVKAHWDPDSWWDTNPMSIQSARHH